MKVNKPIGLFKRLISRAIDFAFVAVISIGLLFILAHVLTLAVRLSSEQKLTV